jgi:hypothetical protein
MNDLRLPDERPLSCARFNATSRELRRLPRRRRSRWGVTVALAGALVLLSAVAAVGYGLITPQERFGSVGCYDRPSLDGSVAVVGISERDPTEVCRQMWADGVVAGSDEPMPADLTACVLPSGGAVGVFPGDDSVCDTLGLQALRDVEIRPGDVSVARLGDAMGERLPSMDETDDDCLDTADVRRLAEEVLDDLGARGWSVTWVGDQADGDVTCGVLDSFDVPARTVALSGVPGPRSDQVRVARRLAELAGDCIGDRDEARAVAEHALRDVGLGDWTVEVDDESWDGNRPGAHGGEQCASFQTMLERRTVVVSSVIHEPESGWRRFVPGM